MFKRAVRTTDPTGNFIDGSYVGGTGKQYTAIFWKVQSGLAFATVLGAAAEAGALRRSRLGLLGEEAHAIFVLNQT